jgi:hypothetical protein
MTNLIALFSGIRNTPYQIIDIPYTIENSYVLIKNKGASCTPKHIVLADQFQKSGFITRFCVHEFLWEDFQIDFNDKIYDLLKKCPRDFHTNLEFKMENHWINVDATWDDPLLELGLPGTKLWNGKDSTLNCVYSLRENKFDTIDEKVKFIEWEQKKLNYNPKDISELINELNVFFDSKRKGKVRGI